MGRSRGRQRVVLHDLLIPVILAILLILVVVVEQETAGRRILIPLGILSNLDPDLGRRWASLKHPRVQLGALFVDVRIQPLRQGRVLFSTLPSLVYQTICGMKPCGLSCRCCIGSLTSLLPVIQTVEPGIS